MNDGESAPTFIPLNGRLGWRTGIVEAISESFAAGLRLAADPDGPLALDSADGSLGGLLLPRGMAIDGQGRLYLLTPNTPWHVRRYDAEQGLFRALPALGGEGNRPRHFRQPTQIAILPRDGVHDNEQPGDLYVADAGNRRVQVFSLRSLALRFLWQAEGERNNWQPTDIAGGAAAVYILDSTNNRIYRRRLGGGRLERWLEGEAGAQWRRVAVDSAGRVYVLDSPANQAVRLLVFSPDGRFLHETSQASDVRERFPVPPLRLVVEKAGQGRPGRAYFCLPDALAHRCDRRFFTGDLPEPSEPWGGVDRHCPPGRLFDRQGKPYSLDPAEQVEPVLYARRGLWISEALDSRLFRCQWHRVELVLAPLPPGTTLRISTISADEKGEKPPSPLSPLWETGLQVVGEMQPPPQSGPSLGWPAPPDDFLIQSHPGQYLWLKVEFLGDGFSSPVLREMRVHFPRRSYLAYLPAVYSGDEESRWFLERFLSIFQTEWDALERRVGHLYGLFDPDSAPAEGGFLELLARWVALPLEKTWRAEQQRVLLQAVAGFYPQRGTAAGLRAFLQAYLQNMTDLTPPEQNGFPFLLESFRERGRLVLNQETGAPGPSQQRIWSQDEVGRLQIGVRAQLGRSRIISTGDPPRDWFHHHAHRFRVFVPATWVSSADDELMLRRALEEEKPAHTAYDLCLIEARFRIGKQSTVGVDTVLGDVPQARLYCEAEMATRAPSRSSVGRLGYDTVLAGVADDPRLPLPAASILKV